MLPPHEEPESLQIRCPQCEQRFKVGIELRDRMVECGSCEHRFRIDDEVIVKNKKFYPGERKKELLESFARVPHTPAVQSTMQTVQYAPEPSHASFEPPSPQRVIAAAVGVFAMVVVALILIYGDRRGAVLDGVTTESRLVIAGFIGLLGGGLLVYGNPRAKLKAVLVAFLFLGGLLTIPFYFKEAARPLESNPLESAQSEATIPVSRDAATDLKQMMAEPLMKERARLASQGGEKKAYGIWLRGMRLSNKSKAMDYLIRATEADPSSHLYPRDGDQWLMVLSGSPLSLDDIALIAAKLGREKDDARIYSEMGVVEVAVDNDVFVEGDIERLQNTNNPAFYDLNRRELESIDLDRALKAVRRLARAEPKIYRDDITRLLTRLVRDVGTDSAKLGDIASALSVWASPEDANSVAAMTAAFQKLRAQKILPTRETVAYLTSRKAVAIAPLLDEMWVADAMSWESLYGDLGPIIEPLILQRFAKTSGSLRQSAVRLLGRAGSSASKNTLQAALNGVDPEQRALIERSLKEIGDRQ